LNRSDRANRLASKGLVFWLAQADLVHEWVLSLCLVLAVAAILGPLLLLFGLKYGTIATLRQRLIEDPRNREIRPLVSRSFDRQWFERLRARPEVAFVVPTTRQIAATVQVHVPGKQAAVALDLVPTAPGDRLLSENGATTPAEHAGVLTAAAAEELGVAVGQTVVMIAKRLKGSSFESGELELEVSAILDPRASTLKTMFVRLAVLEAVEQFKDGRAVPRYGWSGSTPIAQPRYDGLIIALPRPLDEVMQVRLSTNTGFTRIEPLDPEQLVARTGYRIGAGWSVYLLSTQRRPAGDESVRAVSHRLRGKAAALIPWVRGLTAELIGSAGEPLATLNLRALSLYSGDADRLELAPEPAWDEPPNRSVVRRQIILPSDVARPEGQLRLRVTAEQRTLEFPVQPVAGTAPAGLALLPARLAGILNLFRTRSLRYQPEQDRFVLGRRGYAGFRLYAASIDDVDHLRQVFEDMGIPVHTEAARIRDVLELDTYLTLIFWLVATVGLIGGAASLVASLYASVQRKRRELGVLRLLGIGRETLFRLPVYQGVLIAGGGFLVAAGFFQLLAWVINTLFSAHLRSGESLCRLSAAHFLTALAGTLGIAVCASVAAAWRTTSIEPSEALRDE
jgi:putative ABC transport system permease protein